MKFFTLIKQYLSLISSKRASKYKISGKCKKCGACCRNITFIIGKEYVKTPEQFEKMKKWDKKYNHFFISGKKDDVSPDFRVDTAPGDGTGGRAISGLSSASGALLFTCKSLGEDNLCKDYRQRSLYCRMYPFFDTRIRSGNFETFDGCGFRIVPEKSFKDFLK